MNDELEKFLENYILLGSGNDSNVYKSMDETHVAKIYFYLRNCLKKHFPVDKCLSMVESYKYDTLKVKDIIDSGWNKSEKGERSIFLNGKIYEVNITILPQGTSRIMSQKLTDGTVISEVVAVGQEYVQGYNLKQISEHSQKIEGFEDFYDGLNEQSMRVSQMIASVTELTRNVVEVPFGSLFETKFKIDNRNIKPIVNKSNQTLNLIVTDLSTFIVIDYAMFLAK
jgi:hypothetical protein